MYMVISGVRALRPTTCQISPTPSTRSLPHLQNAVPPAASRKDQSKSDPKTSNSGIVEKRFVASGLVGAGAGGGASGSVTGSMSRLSP